MGSEDSRVSLLFNKKLKRRYNYSLTYESYGENKFADEPSKSILIGIDAFTYVNKSANFLAINPNADSLFSETRATLLIYTPELHWADSSDLKFLKVDQDGGQISTTIFWKVDDINDLLVIQNSLKNCQEVDLRLSLEYKDSFFQNFALHIGAVIPVVHLYLNFTNEEP